MFLYIVLFVTFIANIWLGWMMGSWIGIGVFLSFIPFIILLTVGGALALGLVGMLFGKHDDRTQGRRFLRAFLRGWAWLICIVWILPWLLFVALQTANDVFPATLPKITISNGEKTVVFQSMMHVASPGFYADIRQDMERLRGQEYVFFYEWVRPGTPESLVQLNALMGMDISAEMYTIFARIGWLATQNPQEYVGILPSTNVDLSTDEIVALARERNITIPVQEKRETLLDEIQKWYGTLSPVQKNIMRVISRGMLNMLLRTYTNPAVAQELKNTLPIFEIILDQRNILLAEAIVSSPVPNIYIHYGALHYPWVLKLLKEKDPRWQEIARTEFQVIR